MAIFNRPVKCTKEQLLDHYQKNESILATVVKYIYGLLRFFCIIIENLYCISSYLVLSWIVLLPISWLKSDIYSRLENYLYNSLLFIVSSWSLAAGSTVIESGDDYKHLIEEPEKHYHEEYNDIYDIRNSTVIGSNHRSASKEQQHSITNNISLENGVAAERKISNGTPREDVSVSRLLTSNPNNSDYCSSRLQSKTNYIDGENSPTNGRLMSDARNILDPSLGGNESTVEDDEAHMNENKFERIEYEIELASAAGERKLMHRCFKAGNKAEIDNTNQITAAITSNNKKQSVTNAQPSKRTMLLNSSSALNNDSTISRKFTNQQQQQRISKTITLSSALSASTESLKSMQTKPRILFLCNHISTADVPLIMQSFSTMTNQSLLWVLDAQFKPTNFGVVCGSHGDFFVAENSFVDGSLRRQVLKHPDRNLLVLFPEGGFLRKRIDGSNRYANRNGFPITTYVTHPRFGAFKDLIDPSVGVTHIVNATLCYDNIKNPLSILDIVLGTKREPIILNYKLYKRSEINPTEEWLRNIWLEKDKLLKTYYEDRSSFFKRWGNTMRKAQLDWFKVLAVHLFYLLVCYLAIFRLFNATSITMLKARELYYINM